MAMDALPKREARYSAALVTFLVLAFPLSWYPWVLALLSHKGNGGPNPLGLLLAALIAAAVDGGWRGPLNVLRSIVRVRVRPELYASAILLPVAAVGAGIALGLHEGIEIAPKPIPWSDLFDRFVFAFAFVALGEEPAWRGFLLPLLQRRLEPLAATLIIAPIWAFWHLPLMGTEFAWSVVPAFLVTVVGGAIVLTWLYNASGGSVFLTMITHAVINTVSAGYVFTMIKPDDVVRFWALYAVVWVAISILTLLLTGGRLGITPTATADKNAAPQTTSGTGAPRSSSRES